jgi:Uma2 family endonuclease
MLATYVEVTGLGIILNAPFQMKLSHSGREPDVLFVAREHRARLHSTYLEGPADLVVEIISPESSSRDRVTKLREYARDGVPEYWLIDPDRRSTAFHRLDAAGAYRDEVSKASGIYRAQAIPGFWLDTAWLWADPLPAVEAAVLSIAGEAYARHLYAQLRRSGYTGERDR